jgi:hypothetical protein
MRKKVYYSMVAFWAVFIAILLTHIITGTADFCINYSISKYVGLSFPSATAFLLVNIFVSVMMWQYLKPKLKSEWLKLLLKIIVVTLVLLSIFPIGLFDNIIPEPVLFGRTPISFLHVITSRTMFIAMAAFSAMAFYEGKVKNLHDANVRKVALLFFTYAVICTFAFIFFPEIFWQIDLIFESLYIAFFFILVMVF